MGQHVPACMILILLKWLRLLKKLPYACRVAGYRPLIELSPVGKAHLVIIYMERVNTHAARASECRQAPELEKIKEYWSSPSRNKVRLPAGKYIRSGRVGWCTLGQELSRDGQSAARTLLEFDTPANFVSPESVLSAPELPLQVQP